MKNTGAVKNINSIVAAMCEKGFMSGMLGDVSPEFQQEQAARLLDMRDSELRDWLLANKFNITKYCDKLSEWNAIFELVQ